MLISERGGKRQPAHMEPTVRPVAHQVQEQLRPPDKHALRVDVHLQPAHLHVRDMAQVRRRQ